MVSTVDTVAATVEEIRDSLNRSIYVDSIQMDKINTKYNYILLESISQGMSLSDQRERETIIGSNFVILPLYTYYYLVYLY